MKKILLGITASVAAIKTLELTQKMSAVAEIAVIMTNASEYFLKSQYNDLKEMNIRIYRDIDEWPILNGPYSVGENILHIELRRWADLMIVAPLDANTLAKCSYGLCDNLLTSVIRAWDWSKPFIVSPAMNTYMWNNEPTQEQLTILEKRGAKIIQPIEKKLACNDIGMGAMANIDDIVNIVKRYLS